MALQMSRKLVVVVLAVVVAIAAVAGGVWWKRHQAMSAAGSGDALVEKPDGPFRVGACQARLHDDRPALALLFSEAVGNSQSFDQIITVTDLGTSPKEGEEKAEKSDKTKASAPVASAHAKGDWIVSANPHVLLFPFVKPGHQYSIGVGGTLVSASGRKLEVGHSCEVASDQMSPSYFFASKGTVLPAGLNGGLPVVTVNVPEVDVQFLRVAPEKLPRFIEKVAGKRHAPSEDGEEGGDEGDEDEGGNEEGYYDEWSARNRFKGLTSGWQLNELQEVADSVYNGRFIANDVPNSRKVSFLPVEKIKELTEPGVYLAVMSRPGRFEYEYQVTYFYVSDIGLHVRRQVNQTDVFTTSLRSGKAMSSIELEVLDGNGKSLLHGDTDSEGHGVLPGLPDAARLLLAKKGKEISLIALQEPGLDLAEFDIGGHLPRDAKLFAWAGRNLYRPGEKFTVSLLARKADGTALPAAPVKVELKKPDGDVLSSTMWQPNAKMPGYLQQSIDLPPDAATGVWSLQFRADPSAKRPDTVWNFQVEEFLPERMKLTLKSDVGPLRDSGSFAVNVQGDYLYGAPAAGNRLLGSVAQERARIPLPREWPGFIFGDLADDAKKARQELEETVLDDTGKADLNIPMATDATSPIRVRAALSLLESGGRPVVRTVERTWWPADAMIGVRPAFERDVAREGSMAEFELIRVTPAGKFVPLKEASFRLVREDRQYYWRYDQGRGWHSGYTESEEVVQAGGVQIKARAKLALPVGWGRYRLEVTDPETSLTVRYRFYAGWNAQDADSIGNRPDRVRLELSDVPAKPGQNVKVKIVPPHDGEALVLVEADKVLWSTRVQVSTSGTTVSIPIDRNWNRSDMYVSTVVFRPGSQGDRVTPARAVGLAWLPLDREARKLKVAVSAPARVEPEKRMTAKVKVEGAAGKQAMVTLSAVDVGILNISNYKTPDPFDFFFGKHRFGAELSDIYGKLIERMDGIVGKLKWGGDAGMRDTQSMPKKVKLVDLFSGPVMLNAQGEAEIPLNIPDFNGTLRLMAVASTPEAYGSSEREVQVSAPIVAEIAMPRFIAPGDSASIALDVTNMMGGVQDISLKLSADKLLTIAEGERTLKLTDRQRNILRFTVEPTEPYGLSRVTLDLKTQGAKPVVIHREFALQIQPPVPREQDARRMRVEPGGSVKIDPALAERYFRGSSTLSVTLSNKPPLNVRSIVKGLLDYPYGCLEQTTSAAYPHLFIDEEGAKAVGLEPRTREQRAKFVEGAIARIAGMQGSAGGFRLWSGESGNYEHWLTPYVTGFLMDARDAGFNVPEEMSKRANQWMLERLNTAGNQFPSVPTSVKPDAQGRYDARDYDLLRNGHQRFAELAHMGYMLAREQKAPLASLRLLFDQYRDRARSPLALVQLGIALELMGDGKRAKTAIEEAMAKDYGIRADWEWDWLGDYGTSTRDFALAYALMLRHKVEHPQRENLLFKLADRLGKSRYYYSTQERIALFMAARAAGAASGDEWQAVLKTAAGETALGSKVSETRALDPAQLAAGVSIENKGAGILWLEAEASGYPLKQTASSDKIVLERRWFTTDGKPWKPGPLKAGDMLIARVKVSAKQHIEDGLVVDHVPAGLEIENLNLSQGPKAAEFTIDGVNLGEALEDERVKHREYRDDRFVAAARLDGNALNLFYMLRVVTPGRYIVPAPYAEDMYRSDIRATGPASEAITVVDPRAKSKEK